MNQIPIVLETSWPVNHEPIITLGNPKQQFLELFVIAYFVFN